MTEEELQKIDDFLSQWMIAQGRIESNQGIQESVRKSAYELLSIDPDVFEEIAMASYKSTIRSETRKTEMKLDILVYMDMVMVEEASQGRS